MCHHPFTRMCHHPLPNCRAKACDDYDTVMRSGYSHSLCCDVTMMRSGYSHSAVTLRHSAVTLCTRISLCLKTQAAVTQATQQHFSPYLPQMMTGEKTACCLFQALHNIAVDSKGTTHATLFFRFRTARSKPLAVSSDVQILKPNSGSIAVLTAPTVDLIICTHRSTTPFYLIRA